MNVGQDSFNVAFRKAIDLDSDVDDLLNVVRVVSARRVRVHQPLDHAFRVIRERARARRGCKRCLVPEDEQRTIWRPDGDLALVVEIRTCDQHTERQDSHRRLSPISERGRMTAVRGS